jgi:hypothetical protein
VATKVHNKQKAPKTPVAKTPHVAQWTPRGASQSAAWLSSADRRPKEPGLQLGHMVKSLHWVGAGVVCGCTRKGTGPMSLPLKHSDTKPLWLKDEKKKYIYMYIFFHIFHIYLNMYICNHQKNYITWKIIVKTLTHKLWNQRQSSICSVPAFFILLCFFKEACFLEIETKKMGKNV